MFQNISKLKTKQKSFFIENVNLFVKLVNAFALKNKLKISTSECEISEKTIERLKELEIFDTGSIEEQRLLLNLLKNPLFSEFLSAINFSSNHGSHHINACLRKTYVEEQNPEPTFANSLIQED